MPVGRVPAQRPTQDALLRTLVAGTAHATGDDFFRELVRALAAALGVRWAFVSEFVGPARTRVRTLAYVDGDRFKRDIEFDLDGTVCEAVLAGESRHYESGVAARFPRERVLRDMGAEGYLAIPLTDRTGEVMGHLAVIDDKPFHAGEQDLSVFHILGARAAAELQRLSATKALSESEARLSAILSTTTDAIVSVDADQRVVLFNAAAAATFECSERSAIGQPVARFLSPELLDLLREHGQTRATPPGRTQSWAPSGLTARRESGEAFPVEVTLSSARLERTSITTLILRDVTSRERALEELARLRREREYLQAELATSHRFGQFVTRSGRMAELFADLARVASTPSTVLITGETGTGKELIARALHEQSARARGPLIKLNCAALPAELVESEIFGHEKGAFSGAVARRIGRFELAEGGTLFLDEIGELSLSAQAKLLRVLQEREFERVGGSQSVRVDVRLIAATHRDLRGMVEAGSFREDLYYRLSVFPIAVPPLRERPEDIPLLAEHFAQHFASAMGKRIDGVTPAACAALAGYAWPGNVRELQNVIERAVILADPGPLDRLDRLLPNAASPNAASPSAAPLAGVSPAGTSVAGVLSKGSTLAEVERAHIIETLEQCAWVVDGPRGAARELGLNPSTLRFRMQKLGIARPS